MAWSLVTAQEQAGGAGVEQIASHCYRFNWRKGRGCSILAVFLGGLRSHHPLQRMARGPISRPNLQVQPGNSMCSMHQSKLNLSFHHLKTGGDLSGFAQHDAG